MTTDYCINIHQNDPSVPPPTITWKTSSFDEDTPPWGVLSLNVTIHEKPDSDSMDRCLTQVKWFLKGPDWRNQAATIRHAFQSSQLS
jgi:hypothetical protein